MVRGCYVGYKSREKSLDLEAVGRNFIQQLQQLQINVNVIQQ
jgi:hypothetical protein